jgi:hypothetical protein
MNMRADKVEVEIEEVKDSAPAPGRPAVVIETEAKVDGERRDTSIEVQQDDVPAVAVALLNADNQDGTPANDGSGPAVRCLGAGVVHWMSDTHVRFHLQFDSGQVLPIEMSKAAALALCRGLFHQTGAAGSFTPADWGIAPRS